MKSVSAKTFTPTTQGIKAAGRHMFKKAPLGSGKRFAALKHTLTGKKGVSSPGGLAAYIGREKLGKAKFQHLAAVGKKRATK